MYAVLPRLGGELISAASADYEDYKGLLRCPECGEEVFLRAAHTRRGQEVSAAFVHRKAIAEVSVCELRVGRYGADEVEAQAGKARGQRIQSLRKKLWEYLEQNLSANLRIWRKCKKDCEKKYRGDATNSSMAEFVDFGYDALIGNAEFMLSDRLDVLADLLFRQVSGKLARGEARIAISPHAQGLFQEFVGSHQRDWSLHVKIAREAFEVFLGYRMDQLQRRLCYCLCHPSYLEALPELMDLDASTDEWRGKFVSYLTLQVTFVFLTTDWIKIFKKEFR